MPAMPYTYHYDRIDFFFIGVGQAEPCPVTGEPSLPGFATFDPPPSFERDQENIAVFLPIEQRWEMRPNTFWSPQIVDHTVMLRNELDGMLAIRQYDLNSLARFPGIPRVLYPVKFCMALSGRLAYMQNRLDEIAQLYLARRQGCSLQDHFREKFATEDLILNMKRVIDDVFMNEWVLLEGKSEPFLTDRRIRVCEMQEIDKLPAGPTKSHLVSLREADPDFFKVITDLRNSFVHHYSSAETYDLVGLDRPTVNALHIHKGNLMQMRLITVWLEDLVKSFNRFLIRTFEPQNPTL